MSNLKGYTLIELTVTVIVIAVIAGLALNNYLKALQTGYERDILMQLRLIQNTLEFEWRTKKTYPTTDLNDRDAINTALGLQIPQNDFFTSYKYTYYDGAGKPYYIIEIGTVSGWSVAYDDSGSRTYCSSGACPTCDATSCP